MPSLPPKLTSVMKTKSSQVIIQDCLSFSKMSAVYRHLLDSLHERFSGIPVDLYLDVRVILDILFAGSCSRAALKLSSYIFRRMPTADCRIISRTNNVPPSTPPTHRLFTFHLDAPPEQHLYPQSGPASRKTCPGSKGRASSAPP